MVEVLYAASFFEEVAQVETKRVRDNILDATELLGNHLLIRPPLFRQMPDSLGYGYLELCGH